MSLSFFKNRLLIISMEGVLFCWSSVGLAENRGFVWCTALSWTLSVMELKMSFMEAFIVFWIGGGKIFRFLEAEEGV